MKENTLTFLTSFIYIPSMFLGNIIGTAFTFYLNWWNSTMYYNDHWIPYMFEIGQFLGEAAHAIIPGIAGGYLSALFCTKIYQNYNLNIIMILPILFSIFLIFPNIYLVITLGDKLNLGLHITTLITLISFYIFLRDEFISSLKN
ncbi:hypothetical protein OAL90_01380 [Hyphomicrobiales bacterium]|nr:hypothetical protein [Hyphomicrobiales bacterium]